MKICCGAFAVLCLSGCSGLEFSEGYNPKGLTYWEPRPYLFVSVTKDCVWTATPLSLPGGTKRSVSFHSGYGSAALSVTLTNGMITAVGQTTDTKVPETISAIGSLAGAAAKVLTGPTLPAGGPAPNGCKPAAILYEYKRRKVGCALCHPGAALRKTPMICNVWKVSGKPQLTESHNSESYTS